MRLSELIKFIMKKLDLNQMDLSYHLGISQSTISGWLNEKKTLSHRSLKILRDFCKKNKIRFKVEDIL